MTSFKQIAANRRNAHKSTGPITEEGKMQSRCNAVRHGLTAETVIGSLEDAEDYKAFETAVISDYAAQSAVERELVLRLASLLWRLRRATTIETGLFEIEAEHLGKGPTQVSRASDEIVHALFARHKLTDCSNSLVPSREGRAVPLNPAAALTSRFLRLANLPDFALDRLSRYETSLWRQAGQILFTLDALGRRKPQERKFRFPW
jgi:hypothetical protein